MLDKVIFSQNMALLAEIYDKALTKPLQSVYYAVLQDMTDEDFKQAVKRLLQERTFATFPKPAEILALSKVVKEVIVEIDKDEEKAKELIELVHSMNNTIYQEHIRTGIQFDVLLDDVKFPTVEKSIIAILDNVKPYYNHKQLISNINLYGTSKEQLQAFKQAVKQGEVTQIASNVKKLLN